MYYHAHFKNETRTLKMLSDGSDRNGSWVQGSCVLMQFLVTLGDQQRGRKSGEATLR